MFTFLLRCDAMRGSWGGLEWTGGLNWYPEEEEERRGWISPWGGDIIGRLGEGAPAGVVS